MNKKELKSLIKEMVKESLSEIFAEIHLENIVEGVLNKQSKKKPLVENYEMFEQSKPKNVYDTKKMLKENMMQKVGISDDEWKNIYSDVSLDGVSQQIEGPTNPEFVSENDLRKLGLIR